MDIQNVIEFESECTYVDFKTTEYKKADYGHRDFLKDVLSMANAAYVGDRFIIIGVKLLQNGEREIIGIDELTDAATYQQLVQVNIYPDIELSYTPFKINGKTLGVFKISDCQDGPYMMKKAYDSLNKEDCFIRQGTTQRRCSRSDLDRMYTKRNDRTFFTSEVNISFEGSTETTVQLSSPTDITTPSQQLVTLLRKVQKFKQDHPGLVKPVHAQRILGEEGFVFFGHTAEELNESIVEAQARFDEDDLHYLFETKAARINLIVTHHGTDYLVDASAEVIFPVMDGITIAEKIFHKRTKGLSLVRAPDWSDLNYPHVNMSANSITISASLGDVKHHIPKKIFDVPVRIFCRVSTKTEIPILVRLFAKNLKDPQEHKLVIIAQP